VSRAAIVLLTLAAIVVGIVAVLVVAWQDQIQRSYEQYLGSSIYFATDLISLAAACLSPLLSLGALFISLRGEPKATAAWHRFTVAMVCLTSLVLPIVCFLELRQNLWHGGAP
jgi:hypothetical protein